MPRKWFLRLSYIFFCVKKNLKWRTKHLSHFGFAIQLLSFGLNLRLEALQPTKSHSFWEPHTHNLRCISYYCTACAYATTTRCDRRTEREKEKEREHVIKGTGKRKVNQKTNETYFAILHLSFLTRPYRTFCR